MAMTLDEFRKAEGWSLDRTAKELGISGASPARTVHRWITGQRIPRPRQMREIEVRTGGKVTPSDFYRDPLPAQAA
jgi:transcriptional regulator with XRE-family HTH domain